MAMRFVHNDLFKQPANAIILTIDGAAPGMEGNVARQFAKHYPEAWEDLSYDLTYPFPLGASRIYEIAHDAGCDYRYCIIASTLHHVDIMTEEQKLNVIGEAFKHALLLAHQKGASSIGTAVMAGGWRLPIELAFTKMLNIYEALDGVCLNLPDVYICVQDEQQLSKLKCLKAGA